MRGKCAASLKKAGKYIVCAALAVGIYAGIFAVVCAVCKVTPSDYQELSNAVELKNLSPLSSVASSLYIFWKFFVDFSTGINAYSIVNLAFLALWPWDSIPPLRFPAFGADGFSCGRFIRCRFPSAARRSISQTQA